MRKWLSACMIVLLIASVAGASELKLSNVIDKPELKQGFGWDIEDKELKHLSTLEVASFKGVAIEAGYLDEKTIIGAVSYPIVNFSDMGITLPILKYIDANVGAYVGYSRVGSADEFKYGLMLSLITVRF